MERLTNVEELMMHCIWNYGDGMPFLQMGKELKEKYGKDYKRTSIRTYLFRLEEKGYIKVERQGRNAYIWKCIDKEDYKKEKAQNLLDQWFDGSAVELVNALSDKVLKGEKERLNDILDDMDFI